MNLLKSCVFVLIILSLLIASSAFPAVVYVKWDSPGIPDLPGFPPIYDGITWESAFHSLQEALGAAVSGDEVWIARGTYTGCVTMKDGVSLYGGFVGGEELRDERNWMTNLSIMDGNLWGAVISCPGATGGTPVYVIDGITVRNGKAGNGGGIYCNNCNVTIVNCIIKGNTASDNGGGIYCSGSTVTIYNNRIAGNTAIGAYENKGGGIYHAGSGGVIANNTIVGNTAPVAGGIYCYSGSMLVANNIVAYCSDIGICKAALTGYSVTIRNNCSYGNLLGDYSASPALLGVDGNISADPKLASYQYGNLHIQPDSPCINAGDDSAVQTDWLDIDRQARIQGTHVDIGADESSGQTWTVGPYTIVRVKTDGNDVYSGSSWSSAKRTVQAAVTAASDKGGEVWVKAGTYAQRIRLPAFAHLYGGFAGTETSRNQRPAFPRAAPDSYASILDGSATGNVVTAFSGNKCSRIDGFTIRNGKALFAGGTGGGILCSGASTVITNNIVTQNTAVTGGGIYCLTCSPEITSNQITSNSSSNHGGGIYCYAYAQPAITDNTITGNTAPLGGGGVCLSGYRDALLSGNIISQNSNGGVYIRWSSPVRVQGNTISANTGSGIWCEGSPAVISGNTVTGNNALSGGQPYGGGVYCSGAAAPQVIGNTISGNRAAYGNGVCCYGSGANAVIAGNLIAGNGLATDNTKGGGICSLSGARPRIQGNTIAANTAKYSGSWIGGGVYFESCPSALAGNIIAFNSSGICRAVTAELPTSYLNNCVYGNTSYDHSGITAGQNDLSVDPVFIDQAAGNYHLALSSPVIDHGWSDPLYPLLFDMDGEGRIAGLSADIGADEYWSGSLQIRDLKKTADGAVLSGSGATITAVFPGFFYVEMGDRSSGIRVNGSNPDMLPGMAANIQGKLTTTSDGERCVEASSVGLSTGETTKPISMGTRDLGGDDWLYSATYGSGQKGVLGASGLNNIGLLVQIWGKVSHAGSGWFYLDDGSGLQDGSGFTGAKVLTYGLTVPAQNSYVLVTGISSCAKSGDNLHRLIRATQVMAL